MEAERYQLHNAQGEAASPLTPHTLYRALDPDAVQRHLAYRELFRHHLDPGVVDAIRRATNGKYVLGDDRFAAEVTIALGRRAVPGASGRHRKVLEPASGDLFQ